MFTETHFMKTQEFLHKGMNASLARRKIISDNIANVDTPHFKRSELIFESMLKRAVESETIEREKTVPTKISDERHISFFKPLDWKEVNGKTNLDYLTSMRPDGNNVDIEKEIVDSTQNQMVYNLLVERYNQNNRNLTTVMRLA